jgi:hypothetical protein
MHTRTHSSAKDAAIIFFQVWPQARTILSKDTQEAGHNKITLTTNSYFILIINLPKIYQE